MKMNFKFFVFLSIVFSCCSCSNSLSSEQISKQDFSHQFSADYLFLESNCTVKAKHNSDTRDFLFDSGKAYINEKYYSFDKKSANNYICAEYFNNVSSMNSSPFTCINYGKVDFYRHFFDYFWIYYEIVKYEDFTYDSSLKQYIGKGIQSFSYNGGSGNLLIINQIIMKVTNHKISYLYIDSNYDGKLELSFDSIGQTSVFLPIDTIKANLYNYKISEQRFYSEFALKNIAYNWNCMFEFSGVKYYFDKGVFKHDFGAINYYKLKPIDDNHCYLERYFYEILTDECRKSHSKSEPMELSEAIGYIFRSSTFSKEHNILSLNFDKLFFNGLTYSYDTYGTDTRYIKLVCYNSRPQKLAINGREGSFSNFDQVHITIPKAINE